MLLRLTKYVLIVGQRIRFPEGGENLLIRAQKQNLKRSKIMFGLLVAYVFVAVAVGLYFKLAVENDFETSVKKGLTWPAVFVRAIIKGLEE
jgi:hypothetical protein